MQKSRITRYNTCARSLLSVCAGMIIALSAQAAPEDRTMTSTWFNGNLQSGGLFQDRVQTRVNGATNPANVGEGDFTLEIWLKPSNENQGKGVTEGRAKNWYNGNIWLDRSTYYDPGWGGALNRGRIVFNVRDQWQQSYNLIGRKDLRDGAWHFVSLVRQANKLYIFVDGKREDSAAYVKAKANGSFKMPETFSQNYPKSNPFHVLGVEKHDANVKIYPGYWGGMYDMRLSDIARYTDEAVVPKGPMATDEHTVLHWRLDEVTQAEDLTGHGNDGEYIKSAQGFPTVRSDSPFNGE